MTCLHRLYAAMLLISSVTAYPTIPPLFGKPAFPPGGDQFWVPPLDYELLPPGTVLRSRDFNTTVPNAKSAKQFLYRTTDSFGFPIATVVSLYEPTASNTTDDKLVMYSYPYDTADPACGPSFTSNAKDPQPANSAAFANEVSMGMLLSQGYHVATSDYEGANAALVGEQNAKAVLDAVRALTTHKNGSGLQRHAKTILWGFSGGSFSSEFAAEFMPSYAPELTNIVGAAMGGLVNNLTTVLLTVNEGMETGLVNAVTISVGQAYPAWAAYLSTQVLPEYREMFYAIRNQCFDTWLAGYAYKNIFSWLKNGKAILQTKLWKDIATREGILGLHGTPTINFYIYKGTADDVSPVDQADALVTKYCAEGVNIQYDRLVGVNHFDAYSDGQPLAIDFIQRTFNGEVSKGCHVQNVTIQGTH